jgi:ABC-type nickel/cobalt efflux system permease component RcnA
MKNQTILKKASWLLVICIASALLLSACKSTTEHPSKAEHPQKEHPEHPTTNAPPRNP